MNNVKLYYELGNTIESIAKILNTTETYVLSEIEKLSESSREIRKANLKTKKYLENNNIISFSKAKLKKELLYNDDIEKWIIRPSHIKNKNSSIYFKGIVFLKDITDFITSCEVSSYNVAISPCHNKDIWTHNSPEEIDEKTNEIIFKEGERYTRCSPKIPHFHYIIQFESKETFETMYNLHKEIAHNNIAPIPITKIINEYQNLCHENTKRKHIYDRLDNTHINNFSITLTKKDKQKILRDIIKNIKENNINTLKDLKNYYKNADEFLKVISINENILTNLLRKDFYHERKTKK